LEFISGTGRKDCECSRVYYELNGLANKDLQYLTNNYRES